MKALKAKLTAILLSLGCFALCLGVGVAVAQPETAQLTAQAAVTTHEIGALTLHVNSSVGGAKGSNNVLYLARADGEALPVLSWADVFVHESGYGFKVNGVRKTPKEIKSTGDGFYWSFDALNAGDVITISGTFYCESQQTKYVIEKSTFTWNGTKWSVGPALDTYSSFTINEIGPANGCTASVVNAYPINDGKPTIASWDHALTFFEGSGAGVCLNGERLSGWEIKQPGDFYIVLGKAAKAGDVLTIDGIFYNEEKAAKVVFNNSSLQYNGTSWVAYGKADSYSITKINGTGECTSSKIYAYPLIENKPEIADWDNGFSFREGSGEGFMFNGDLVTGWELKQPGDFYMVLGREAVEGDVVTLDGIFYNSTLGAQIEFDESSLQYNGKTWIQYKEVNIAPTKIGKVKIGSGSDATAVYFNKVSGAAFEVTEGTWTEKLTYKLGSGVGVRINGEQIVMDDIKIPNNLYVNLKTTAKEGDILSIGGEFYNESLNINYAIEESKFVWNGSAWETYFDTYEIGKVKIGNGSDATAVYFDKVSGAAFEVTEGTWTEKLTYESGRGVTLNGKQINMGDIKIPNNLFVGLGATAQTGDVLVIGGTFYNANLAVKYVIEDSKFVWNGSAWVDLVYTTHEIGALNLHTNSQPWGGAGKVSNQLYLARADGKALPVLSWDVLFEIETAGTFKINGVAKTPKEIKSTDAGFFWNFDTLSEGDIVTINGTVTCDAAAARYVITESHFLWNGSAWEKYVPPVEYTTYNVGKVIIANGSSATAVYFAIASGGKFAVVDGTWTEKLTYESGTGVTLNGTQINMNDIKIPNDIHVGLGTTAKMGDVLVIGGTFYNEKLAVKYVIEDSKFVWNGTAWEKYVAYTTYNVGAVKIGANSEASKVYFDKASGGKFEVTDGSWTEKLTYESGTGVTLNGTQIGMGDIKIPGNLYVGLGATPKTGDVLVIGGTFYNENLAVKYVIEDSKFEWNGTAWIPYVAYTTYKIGAVKIGGGSGAAAVYFDKVSGAAFEVTEGTWTEKLTYESGTGVTLNGTQINMNDIKIPNNLYVGLGKTAKTGDVLVIGGTFYNTNLAVKYVIEDSQFVWNGSAWFNYVYVAEEELEYADTVTILDLGLGTDLGLSGTTDKYVNSAYLPNDENTTGSIKFRFGYQSTNLAQGEVAIRLRGGDWTGYHFRMHSGGIDGVNPEMPVIELNNNKYYLIEIGAIDMTDGENVWIYVKIDGVICFSTTMEKSGENAGFNTNNVSLYFGNVAQSTISDPDNVSITYSSDGTIFTEYAERNSTYKLAKARGKNSNNVVLGWISGDTLYASSQEITVTGNMEFTALTIEFFMEDGAAIRLATTADESGIRFTSYIKEAQLDALAGYGITDISFGTLILPYDYLDTNVKPNLDGKFIVGQTIIQIESTYQELDEYGYLVYRGAMRKLNTGNYDRLFAGRGYMTLTFADGTEKTVYTNFDYEDNVRSIRNVAQRFQEDGEKYNDLDTKKKEVVDVYAARDGISLMKYEAYAKNTFLNVVAWYYPELNPTNAYMNEENDAIAQKMKDTGVKAVYLDGNYHLNLDTHVNIEKTRQIIKFFWSHGLYTIAFGSNASDNGDSDKYPNGVIDYSAKSFPDFSDCEGFIGFLVWDEPGLDKMGTLADFARNFEIVYAGTGVTYMTNLLPSYADAFNEGKANKWEGSLSTLQVNEYTAYLAEYCETVLSQVSGERWLSLDSYPIKADYSLMENFLFDLAMLKYYSLQYDAHAHAVLQGSGWIEGSDSTMNRMPTEAELRMQAYTAMAFGVDSISWWSYSDKRGDNQQNPTDNDDYYTRFANVNNELAAIGHIYSAFDWKGVILGVGTDNWSISSGADADYEAMDFVKGKIGDYELVVDDTKNLSSVATNQTNLNYLVGVMQDMNGNEGYVLCNYNNHKTDRAQTITLTFKTNVTDVIIYRKGTNENQTEKVSNKTLKITLATGEGVIILPSKLG